MVGVAACLTAGAYFLLPLPGLRQYSGPPPLLAFDANIASGFFVDAAGAILTNRHAVQDCRRVTVAGWNFRAAPARIVGIAAASGDDLAILKVGFDAPGTLAFADEPWPDVPAPGAVVPTEELAAALRAADVEPHRPAAMVGYPVGDLMPAPESTPVELLATAGSNDRRHWLRPFDGAVAQGNSGSPVIDHRGRVVGVATELTVELDPATHRMTTGDLVRTSHGLVGRHGLMIPAAAAVAFARRSGVSLSPSRASVGQDPSRAVVRVFCFHTLPFDPWA